MSKEIRTWGKAHSGTLRLDFLPCINYSIQLARVPIIQTLELFNGDADHWNNVAVRLKGPYITESQAVVDCVPAGGCVAITNLDVKPETETLLNSTEAIDTTFTVEVSMGDEILFQTIEDIRILPFDYWVGTSICPSLLSAFVTPNHPILSHIIVEASKLLEKWTGKSAMDAYQTQDRNRVRLQVAAIFEALRGEGMIYVESPASFETIGQRIRLCDRALTEKMANCLDASLLMASCLEAVGLYPLIAIITGHAFVGAWLTQDCYSQNVGDDASFLLKKCADGVNDMVFVEAVSLTSSGSIGFDEAVKKAVQHLIDEQNFQMFIDVHRCRMDHLRPLPQRIQENGIWTLKYDGVPHLGAGTADIARPDHYALHLEENTNANHVTKQSIWERKLLDFSLRNNLINMRLGKRIIPFVSYNIDRFEDCLQDGDAFSILPFPDTVIQPNDNGIYDTRVQAPALEQIVNDGLNTKRFISYLSENDLKNSLKFVYRTARTSLEESGANSLFMAIGLLKWYENRKSVQPRFAPILLLPVEMVRRGTGYVIRSREEDIMLNITLVEFLKQMFDIKLSALDPLPVDEHGVDVRKVFSAIRQYIGEVKRWDVLEESMLGLFSFGKFVMWNDIHANASRLRQNKIVSTLMENRLKWNDPVNDVDARQMDKIVKPQRTAIPLDVDSSQMEAIIESGEGKSFILHGPPGTGKSQTITNMIANALYQGKRVLFVAEKMAALEVVQRRLTQIGLDTFCLELHSNKVAKQHVLGQLKKALEVTRVQAPQKFEEVGNKIYEYRQRMIGNAEALHKQQPSGLSLFDCINHYLAIEGEEMDGQLPAPNLVNRSLLEHWTAIIEDLDAVFKITGNPSQSPFAGLEPLESRQDLLSKLYEILPKYKDCFIQYKASADRFAAQVLPQPQSDTMEGCEQMAALANVLSNAWLLTPELLSRSADTDVCREVQTAVSQGHKRDKLRQQILAQCNPGFLQADPDRLQNEWNGIQTKWFLPKWLGKRAFLKSFRQYKADVNETDVAGLLHSLADHNQSAAACERYGHSVKSLFGTVAQAGSEDWDKIDQALNSARQIMQLLTNFSNAGGLSLQSVLDGFWQKVGNNFSLFRQQHAADMQQLLTCRDEHNRTYGQLTACAHVSLPTTEVSNKVPEKVQGWIDHFDDIKDWCHWVLRKNELHVEGLDCVSRYIESHAVSAHQAANALLKGIYHQLIAFTIESDESLRMFNALLFEDMIEHYRQETKKFQQLTKQELYCRLASNIPSQTMEAAQNSEMGILKRNINNGGRGTSIRKLIDQIPTLLPKLCPCMLMSPMSVAQFINLNHDPFDLVIFDEASQMPTCEAVGAIARGKSLVVVGDPLQMPPTSFFSTSAVDEDEAEFDDMDSILDDCITMSIPSRYLTWHYRSKHESLIAFSNTQYYGGKLLTFPSVDDRSSKISLVHVDGAYDKGRTRSNPYEARAIVAEVLRRLSDNEMCKYSIGIVAFSKVQQTLIEDLLDEALAKRPELEEIAHGGDEPLFIKNLENVQGDERDVILFSVGYGPDKNGNVSMNFGPLNNAGGERRLNVAVSRARYEMKVFSTLWASQIDLRRSNAKGVAGLKKFLEYAEQGSAVLPVTNANSVVADSVITGLADALRANGYQVDMMVGKSRFKMDLAVLNPDNTGEYLLGIMNDGQNYYGIKTMRDREICQPKVLKMLHWNVLRVWSVDWFEHRDKVVQRILETLGQLREMASMGQNNAETAQPMPDPQPIFSNADAGTFQMMDSQPVVSLVNERERHYMFAQLRPYNGHEKVDVDFLRNHIDIVRSQVQRIVETEQPVVYLYLCKRVAALWGIARVTTRLQSLVEDCLAGYYCDSSAGDERSAVYWVSEADASSFNAYRVNSKRNIAETPIVELANAAVYAIEQQLSMPREDMKRISANLLGFTRMGVNVDTATEKALQRLLSNGVLREDNGRIFMANGK